MSAPYSVQRPVASYGSFGSRAGKCTSWAPMASISSRTISLDLAQHLVAQRQPGVDARGGAADVAGAHQPAVAGHLGVGRVLAQGPDEQLRHAGDHGQQLYSPARARSRAYAAVFLPRSHGGKALSCSAWSSRRHPRRALPDARPGVARVAAGRRRRPWAARPRPGSSRAGRPGAYRVTKVGMYSARSPLNRPVRTRSKRSRAVTPSAPCGTVAPCWATVLPRP